LHSVLDGSAAQALFIKVFFFCRDTGIATIRVIRVDIANQKVFLFIISLFIKKEGFTPPILDRLSIIKNTSYKVFPKIGSFNKICFYECRVTFIMQISFFAKVVLFLTLYCISDLSIKNNILRKVINRANRAKKI